MHRDHAVAAHREVEVNGPPSARLSADRLADLELLDLSGARLWPVEDGVTVTVDGSGIADPDDGHPLPAVVVTLAPYAARHLARLLDDWTTLAALLESARGADERDLARALHEAARAAETLRAGNADGNADRTGPGTQRG